MTFPSVDGKSLAGVEVAFPRDFAAPTIALVAFDLKARDQLDSWVPFVDSCVRAGRADGRVFPVLPKSMGMVKGMIVSTMRKAVPNAEAIAATVPLFVDIDAFCAALAIDDRAALHVYLVAPGGVVLAHETGAYSDSAGAAIQAHVG